MNGVRAAWSLSEKNRLECKGRPSVSRMEQGPVAWLECTECIACNPCERSCPMGAIHIGEVISEKPVLDETRCVGCGNCISQCSGLAITVIDLSGKDGAALTFPYEYLPLPKVGDTVQAVNRAGETVCPATVVSIYQKPADHGTAVITIRLPRDSALQVKSIQRLKTEV